MRVGLMQEGQCPPGTTQQERLLEMMEEAILADELGYAIYGNGEQHFGSYLATVSSPDITHSFLAGRTERIRLRAMSINMIPFNHPVRIAEQVATLDVLSGGRAELGGARSNNPVTLDAFGILPTETKAYRDEILQIVAKALSTGEFEHHGELYDIPLRKLAPPPVQDSIPIHISSTGVESHRNAGHMGIGVMTGNSILGWEYAQSCIDAYRETIGSAQPIAGTVTDRIGFFSTGVNCSLDRDEAKQDGGPVALKFVQTVMGIYTDLSAKSPDYAYLGQIEKLRDRIDDLDYLMDAAPYIAMGTPDDLIAHATRLHGMGVDDMLWRVDGMGHEKNMKAIELIGKHVIPVLAEFPEHDRSAMASG